MAARCTHLKFVMTDGGPEIYGLLLACIGAGAVAGAPAVAFA